MKCKKRKERIIYEAEEKKGKEESDYELKRGKKRKRKERQKSWARIAEERKGN